MEAGYGLRTVNAGWRNAATRQSTLYVLDEVILARGRSKVMRLLRTYQVLQCLEQKMQSPWILKKHETRDYIL